MLLFFKKTQMIFKRLYLLIFFSSFISSFANAQVCLNYEIFDRLDLSTENFIIAEADSSSVDNKNIFNLSGNATILSPDYSLSADKVILNKDSKQSYSSGNVSFHDKDFLILSNNLTVDKKNDVNFISAKDAVFSIPLKKIRGSAINLSGDSNIKTLKDATYTRCPVGNDNWIIKSDVITLNSNTNRGTAENAWLKLYGMPIAYSPQINWVIRGKGSGFLAPSYSSYSDSQSSKKGHKVDIPYFFNIAPDRDLLLSLGYLTTRGATINGKYRQLMYRNEGRLDSEFTFLNNDKITKKNRWGIDNSLDLTLKDNSTINIDLKRVSDKNFFQEVSHENTSIDRLISSVNFNLNNQPFGANFYSESEQIVNSGSHSYTKKAELDLSKNIKIDDETSLDLSSSTTFFDNKEISNPSVVRNDVNFKIGKTFSDLAYSFTPSLSLINTNYDLENVPDVNRSIYKFNSEAKIFLEREVLVFDNIFTQTLIPKISYSYTPKKNQNLIPNFDTEITSDSSYESLFNLSNFIGKDKISNENNVVIGFESEFINDNSGETNLLIKAAQKFYLDDKLLDSDGNFTPTSESSRGYSNISAGFELNLKSLSINNEMTYDPSMDKTVTNNLSISYLPYTHSFINFSLINDSNNDHAQLSGSYEINETDNLFWNLSKNLTANSFDRQTIGLSRNDCCLAYRFAFFKKRLNETSYTYERAFELVFKGLSSTTPSLKNKLEAEIPNYLGSLDFISD